MPELEEKFEEPVQYNISDAFVPLKSLRHLPRILAEKDTFVKYTELAGNLLVLPAAQGILYYSLYMVRFGLD